MMYVLNEYNTIQCKRLHRCMVDLRESGSYPLHCPQINNVRKYVPICPNNCAFVLISPNNSSKFVLICPNILTILS